MGRNQRFSKVLADKGISQTEYAKRIGVSSAAVNAWCNRGGLGIDPIERLLIEFPDVDARWLITGEYSKKENLQKESDRLYENKENFSPLIEYLRADNISLNEEVRRLTYDNGALKKEIEYLKNIESKE